MLCTPFYLLCLQVDLPVHLTSGNTVLVTFSGEGYDPKQTEKKDTPFFYESATVRVCYYYNSQM